MSKNELSLVRYRYNSAQVLAEILRDELNSSDGQSNDDLLDGDIESDVDEDTVETAVDVADEFGVNDVVEPETGSSSGHNKDDGSDSNATIDYDLPHDVHDTLSPTTHDDDDGNDVMWSRCGSIAWKRRCPAPSRHPAHNVLAEQRGLPDGVQFDTIADAFRIFVDEAMVNHILLCTNRHAAEIKATSARLRWTDLSPTEFYAFFGLHLLAGVQKARNRRLGEL